MCGHVAESDWFVQPFDWLILPPVLLVCVCITLYMHLNGFDCVSNDRAFAPCIKSISVCLFSHVCACAIDVNYI